MALPASDSFTGANGTLAAYSASWTQNIGAMNINSNGVVPNSASDQSQASWNADTPNNDQYSQITVAAISGGVYLGPAIRLPTSGVGGYYVEADGGSGSDGFYVFKNVSNVETQLGSKTAVVAVSDALKLTGAGTLITPNKNGSTTGTPGAQTDSSIASGRIGINGWGQGTGSRMDDWTGGNVSAAATSFPPVRRPRLYRRR